MSKKRFEQLPDFLIIGAGKSGTTSLDNYLRQHPQLFIPAIKEPNFFGYETISLTDLNDDKDEILHYQNSVTQLSDYLNLFQNASQHQIKGETSNTYLYHERAPERILHYNSDCKLIAVLRQPAERLYSRFLHLARDNRLPTLSFSDCLNENTIWWKRNDLIKEGFYFKNLSRYFRLFPKENIRIYLYEELNKNADGVLKDIYRFLQVDEQFETDHSIRYNQSGFVRNKLLNKLYGNAGVIPKAVKTLMPGALAKKLKNNLRIQQALTYLRAKNLKRPRLDAEIKGTLTNKVYRNDIVNLQELIGKDLSHWL